MVAGAGIWTYTLISVIVVSAISFIGVLTLSMEERKLRKVLIYFVSFSAGALFGDAFLHLLPEAVENGFTVNISLYVLLGILIFFVLEKVILWRHCHFTLHGPQECYPFAYTNLVGDGLHNFIDGIIIAASYIVSIPVGIATTVAVILHEVPQEIGDFGILLHGGFSKRGALMVNFFTALTSVLGAIITLLLIGVVENLTLILIPIAAGGFIYIAGSDLIPELHKETKISKSISQLIAFVLGIAVMFALLFLGG